MRLDKNRALQIAKVAMTIAGEDITDYAGYYCIWQDDDDPEINYAVAINKDRMDSREARCFVIYVSGPPTEEGWWEYTEHLDVEELAETLMRIAMNIEIQEMKSRGISAINE